MADRVYKLPSSGPASGPDFGKDLNAEQRKAACAEDGPMLILAGAGTGKTRTLIYRLAWLVAGGVAPEQVLLLTFTNKAAREMLNRAEELLGGAARRVVGGTFHHVGNVLLRAHGQRLGYSSGYTVIDPGDAQDLMGACAAELGFSKTDRRSPRPEVLQRALSRSINTGQPFAEALTARHPHFAKSVAGAEAVCTRFVERKIDLQVMDYDDLLLGWKLLLEDHPEVATTIRSRFRCVLVDEYQDTNALQGALVDSMARDHRNITVVGDDCQAIYSFRGASFQNILGFPERYPGCRVVKLTDNYRSSPQILDLANRSISRNKRQFPKSLEAVRKAGDPAVVVPCNDTRQQAAFVAHRVLELRDEGQPLREMAVLYRAHRHAAELEVELKKRDIPYVVRSGTRFFEKAHIKDVLAYLRILENPRDELAWFRVLRLQRGVGQGRAQRIVEQLRHSAKPLELLAREPEPGNLPRGARRGWETLRSLLLSLLEPTMREAPGLLIASILEEGYQAHLETQHADPARRAEDIRTLAGYAAGFDRLLAFLDEVSGMTEIAGEGFKAAAPADDEQLVLSTVHQAKGLEWNEVFIIGLCEGLFPLPMAFRNEDELEEERRLFYVAATRARSGLHLVYPVFGADRHFREVVKSPSTFLTELYGEPPVFETWRVAEEAP